MTAADELYGKQHRQIEAAPPPDDKERSASGAASRKPAQRLDFDVVIATRNRPQALALSIPLILGQSRQPRKLIVIDSSDDHAAVAKVVGETTAGWGGTVIVEHSGPGAAYQRNRGLVHVESEIVLFPDDDSLFHPGTS
jgi:glycosyltransferase involved in cell wall biosynthesis